MGTRRTLERCVHKPRKLEETGGPCPRGLGAQGAADTLSLDLLRCKGIAARKVWGVCV